MKDSNDLLILDCESSGLSEHSYPISIGVSGPDGQVWYWMICPLEDWDEWDSFAEAIHGIDREQLTQQGRDAFLVAREMNAVFKGKSIYSDSRWDSHWIKKLFDDSGVKMAFSIKTLLDVLSTKEKEEYENWVESNKLTHHPVQDATRIRNYVLENNISLISSSDQGQYPHTPSPC